MPKPPVLTVWKSGLQRKLLIHIPKTEILTPSLTTNQLIFFIKTQADNQYLNFHCEQDGSHYLHNPKVSVQYKFEKNG